MNQGNVDNRGITNHGGIVSGNIHSSYEHGVKLVGSVAKVIYMYEEHWQLLTAYSITMVSSLQKKKTVIDHRSHALRMWSLFVPVMF